MKKVPVQSVKRAFDILDFLSIGNLSGTGVALQEIAKHVQLADTTVHNILKSMIASGYVAQSDSRRYILGPKCQGLVRSISISHASNTISAALSRLADTTGESSVLTTMLNGQCYQTSTATGSQMIRVSPSVEFGAAFWSLVTARVLAAYASPAELAIILEVNGLPGDEWPAVTGRDELDAALAGIRADGIAYKTTDELKAVAIPLLDAGQRVYCSLGVYLPLYRATDEHMKAIETGIRQVAETILRDMAT